MAVVKTFSRSVEVYDNDGHQWIMRGITVTNVESVSDDSIEIVSHDDVIQKFSMDHSPIYPPVTLAVTKGGKVATFDWQDNHWKETTGSLSNYNQEMHVKQVALRKSGRLMCILYENRIFIVFRRDDIYSQWNEIRRIDFEGCRFFTVPHNGETYILANNKALKIYSANVEEKVVAREFDLPVRKITTSTKGDRLAVLLGKRWNKGIISVYNITSFDFQQLAENIRGIPYGATEMAFVDIGLSLIVKYEGSVYSSEDEIGIFIQTWIGNKWISQREDRSAKDLLISDNGKVVVFLLELRNAYTFRVYSLKDECGNGKEPVHVTVNLGSYQESIKWDIIDTTSPENWKILESGGPYPTGSTSFAYEFCIPTEFFEKDSEKCLALKVTDTGLNGLSEPGSIGIANGGSMYKTIKSTNGYIDIVAISESEVCRKPLLEPTPWAKYSFQIHEECKMSECEYEHIGQAHMYTEFTVKYPFGTLFESSANSLSSDGFILAVSSQDPTKSKTSLVRILKYNDTYSAFTQHGNNITVDTASERFGWAKSLSADGSIVAIGDDHLHTNRTDPGQVYVFAYDKEISNWHQRGNTINGPVNSTFGSSISISADGSIIAIASQPSFQNEDCNVFVYNYDKNTKKWTIKGECINTLHDIILQSTATSLSLSSNGRFLVIGVYNSGPIGQEYSGTVFCYKYTASINRWKRIGKEIRGNAQYHSLGYSVSISADGFIIAMSGYNGFPVKVFEYSNDIHDWRQLGGDIPTTGPEGAVIPKLSSNGEILVISMVDSWYVNYYDKDLDQWFYQYVSKYQEAADLPGILRIAVSADALTVAVANKFEENVVVRRLRKVESSKCQQDESLFNFTIIPDLFPGDIHWRVFNLGGKIAGSVLPSSAVEKLNYTLCLSKNQIYTFSIYDKYSDGICCDWGEGKFYVEYDEKPVMDSENMQHFEIEFKCLSQFELYDMSSVLTLHFDPKNSTIRDNKVQWSLVKGNEKVMDEKLLIVPRWFGLCVEINECWTFGSSHAEGKGENYTIKIANQTYGNTDTFYYISKTKIGNCESEVIRTCPDDKKLFELDLYTDLGSSEIFWDFTGLNLTRISAKDVHRLIEFHGCVSPATSGCAEFILLDLSGDSNSMYDVKFDGERYSGNFSTNVHKEYFGGDHCTKKLSCGKNEGLFEIDFTTHENSRPSFSWEISEDQNRTILASGGNYKPSKHFYDAVCLPLTKCMEFIRSDNIEDRKGTIFKLVWNNELMINRQLGIFNNNKNTVQFGLCRNETRN